jgi:hypothetical protein
MDTLRGYNLLTAKPVLMVANVAEDDTVQQASAAALKERYGEPHVLVVSARIEAELAQLGPDERAEFLGELGLGEGGIDRLVGAAYDRLDLITFYTLANDKLQAWQLPRGTTAPAAAGRIHTDMETGFIRAEVTTTVDLEAAGGAVAKLRETGRLRAEGRDHVVEDGEVITFLFR